MGGKLPVELILEILLQLPVKSLLRFKCVSKSWLSLISSNYFIKSHLKISSTHQNYKNYWILAHDSSTIKQFSLHSSILEPITHAFEIQDSHANFFHKEPSCISIVGSCNGLICVAINQKEVYLWNPSTRISKKLPDSRFPFIEQLHCASYIIYGFAFDENNDDYVVVAIRCILRFLKTEVRIYSLKTDSWKQTDGIPGGYPFYGSGKFASGKIHWACFGGKDDRFIVSLDVQKAHYGKIEMPDCGDNGFLCPALQVLGEWLCVTCNNNSLELWIMRDYGVKDSWMKIKMSPNPRKMPVWISKEEEILVIIDDGLVFYSLEATLLKKNIITNMEGVSDAVMYFESLISPIRDKRMENSS